MAKTHKRRGLEKRLEVLGWQLHPQWWITDGTKLTLGFSSLQQVETAVDWLESLDLKTAPDLTEDINAHFLHSIAENAIYALESAGADAELKLLLDYLEKVLARIHNPA